MGKVPFLELRKVSFFGLQQAKLKLNKTKQKVFQNLCDIVSIVERAQRTGLNFSIFPTIWRLNCSSCEKLVPRPPKSKFLKNEKNISRYLPKEQVCQISAKSNHFWSLQAAPKFWRKTRPQAPKIKVFEKWKKSPQIFTQGTSVPNFSQIEPFLKPPGCPNKVLGQTDQGCHVCQKCLELP